MRGHRIAIILVFLFLFSSLSVIDFESKESQSLETPAFAQESDEDFTKGGYHVATGKWWEPVGYTQSVDDWDGDGFENSLDSFPLDSARPQLILPRQSVPCTVDSNQTDCIGDYIGTSYYDSPSWTSLEQEQTQAIALADVDGDGDLDMGVGNWNSRTKVLENVAGVFGEPLWEGEDLIDCDGMAFGDVDGDGLPELALAIFPTINEITGEYNQDGYSRVLKNLGGTFDFDQYLWIQELNAKTEDIEFVDVEGDGDLDLFLGNSNNDSRLYLNENGVISNTSHWEYDHSGALQDIEFGDIDGDGDQDISIGRHAGTQEIFLWGDVPEFNTQRIDYTISSAHDYENDTDEEYVISVPGIDGIQLFIENFSTYNRYDRLMIKDLEGNILQTYHGQLGNFTTRWFEESGIVIHFETSATYSDYGFDITGYQTGMKNGMTTPSFAHSPIFSIGTLDSPWEGGENKYSAANTVAWSDYDGDGDLDLSIGYSAVEFYYNQCYYGGFVGIYENINNSFSKTPVWNSKGCNEIMDMAWFDIDKDGDEDLVIGNGEYWNSSIGNYQNHPIQIYRNDDGIITENPVWESSSKYKLSMIKAGDFDGNKVMDIVTGTFSLNELYHFNTNSVVSTTSWMDEEGSVTVRGGWGDVDNDGDLDFVEANFLQPDKLYLNDGTSLQTTSSWQGGTLKRFYSVAPTWGDVDGDGDDDLFVGYHEDQPSELYLWENGSLQTEPIWVTPSKLQVNDAKWGDMDNDGDLDLVVGSLIDNIRMFRNDGDPSNLTEVVLTSNLSWISRISLVDIDSDGDLDISACNQNKADEIFLNHDGVISPYSNYTTTEEEDCWREHWVDLDNNGFPDRIVGHLDIGVKIFYNTAGELSLLESWTSPIQNDTTAIETGDIDGDGWIDLIIGHSDNETFLFRNNNGLIEDLPSWNSSLFTDRNAYYRHLYLEDFNLDGQLDLLAVLSATYNQTSEQNDNNGSIILFNGTDGMLFSNHTVIKMHDVTSPYVSITKNNNLGKLTFAICGAYQQDRIYELEDFNLSRKEWIVSTLNYGRSYSAEWGDYDNDGDYDLAIIGRLNELSKIYENVNGTLSFLPVWESSGMFNSRYGQFADMDGNGWVDLVVFSEGGPTEIHYNHNGTIESTASWNSTERSLTKHGKVADINGDGWYDIIVANKDAPIQIYFNNEGNITTYSNWNSSLIKWVSHISVGDVDRDGDLDLASANLLGGGADRIQVYVNNGTGLEYFPSWNSTDTFMGRGVEWGDADGDGDLDLAIVTDSTDKIFLNEGGTLNPVPVWSSEESAMSFGLTWADVNRDGTADMMVFSTNGPNRLYLSTSDKDSDFLSDTIDDFQLDPTQESDKDGDGYGDNTMGRLFDNCDGVPGTSWRDRRGCSDMDGDGQSDLQDAFMNQITQWMDTDGDGLGDNWADNQTTATRSANWPGEYVENAYNPDPSPYDFDNDGYMDQMFESLGAIGPFDDCPLSAGYSWKDEVGCKDTDGDGYSDLFDSHKNDWTQSSDPDRDGFGDNSSGNLPDGCPLTWGNSTKDIYGCPDVDGDGWSYLSDYNDTNSLVWSDSDTDGFTDQLGHPKTDDCPGVSGNSSRYLRGCTDMDGDGIPDSLDDDIDGDGISNVLEIQMENDPLNASSVPSDADSDGMPDDLDDDDDNDNFPDDFEIARGSDPFDRMENPINMYGGFATGTYYTPGAWFSTTYSEDGYELSLSGILNLITSEFLIPLLLIPLTTLLVMKKKRRFNEIKTRIDGVMDQTVLIEIEQEIDELIEKKHLKIEQSLLLRNAFERKEKELEKLASNQTTSTEKDWSTPLPHQDVNAQMNTYQYQSPTQIQPGYVESTPYQSSAPSYGQPTPMFHPPQPSVQQPIQSAPQVNYSAPPPQTPSLAARPDSVFNGFEWINFNNQLWYREIGSLTNWNMYDDSL